MEIFVELLIVTALLFFGFFGICGGNMVRAMKVVMGTMVVMAVTIAVILLIGI